METITNSKTKQSKREKKEREDIVPAVASKMVEGQLSVKLCRNTEPTGEVIQLRANENECFAC